jgi:hypothetical protein
MAATRTGTALTWASGSSTTSGTTNAVDISTDYGRQLFYSLTTGGTPTTGPSFQVQVQPPSSTNWYTFITISPGTTAQTVTNVIDLPIGAGKVQVVYSAASGGTSPTSTLVLEIGEVTGI